jgi:hypothetical protein
MKRSRPLRSFARRSNVPRHGVRRQWRGGESLEARAMLTAGSALDSLFAVPAFETSAVTNPTPRGYTPAQVASAYGVNQISFQNGTLVGNGSGQTIAIVDAYDDPNLAADLHTFDQTFGLADPPSFSKLNQNGGTALPAANAGWSEEISLDVEWAHAMAPGANILLVEANSSSFTDLLAAVDVARQASGVSVVSMSWGSSEFSSETQFDSHFTTPAGHTPVTFFASAGDSGAGAMWPAASPNVIAVGGTSLNLAGSSYASESGWSGSGGGFSQFEAEPAAQRSVQTTGARSVPDVGYDADPNTGFAVYDTMAVSGRTGWFEIGGTSAGAPQWASLFAIANQGRAAAGQSALSGGPSTVYNLPSSDFHDVVGGSNGYTAGAGYDLVTGRGTPIANAVVHDLVSNVTTTGTTTTTGSTTTTTSTSNTSTPQQHYHYYYELVYANGHWWLVRVITNAAEESTPPTPVPSNIAQIVSTAVSQSSSATSQTAPALAANPVASAEQANSAAPPSAAPLLVSASLRWSTGGTGARVEGETDATDGADDRADEEPEVTGALPVVEPMQAGTAAPLASMSAAGDPFELPSGDTLGAAFDACFAGETWSMPLADALVIVPPLVTEALAQAREANLLVVATGVAMAVNVARGSEKQPAPGRSPERRRRHQVCRLEGR